MNTKTHLGSTPLNLEKLRDIARKELPEVLDKIQGKKGLVLDPQLTGPLSLVVEFTLLKDHGVEKIYHIDETLETDCTGLIYLCRPQQKYMRYIAGHIKSLHQSDKKPECWLFFVPERTLVCERVLEEQGVKGDISIGDYAMDWIPYEDDLISMELDPGTWKDIYLDGDQTAIYYAARSLMKFQSIYGLFPRILGKGDAAKKLADMLVRMRREQAVINGVSSTAAAKNPSLLNSVSNHIDQLIIIDRNVDTVTPLCTELTYEGLVDETLGIKHGMVELDAHLVTPPQQQQQQQQQHQQATTSSQSKPPTAANPAGKKKKYGLNSSDTLFSELRDQNFAVVGAMLSKIAKKINEDYEKRHDAKTVAQIRDFVGRLSDIQKEHQTLRIHTEIAELIMEHTMTDEFNKILEVQQNVVAGIDGNKEPDYIEEMINKQKPLTLVLRLLCLMSQAQGGLTPKLYDHFQREIVQTYGYEHIETLHRLEKLGLLNRRTKSASSRAFAQSRRLLRLIVDDVDELEPNDISYVYSGYAPLSVRLVQAALQKSSNGSHQHVGSSTASLFSRDDRSAVSGRTQSNGTSSYGSWRGSEEAIRFLPGKAFEIDQTVERGPETHAAMARAKRFGLEQNKTTVVFFLGGCTHTEVSAIRFLAEGDKSRDYLVATTQMINGTSFLEPILVPATPRATTEHIGSGNLP